MGATPLDVVSGATPSGALYMKPTVRPGVQEQISRVLQANGNVGKVDPELPLVDVHAVWKLFE